MRLFRDRQQAAHQLADCLQFLRDDQPIVLGIANGGVPLAAIVAEELDAPLDVLIIEKLFAPARPQDVVGAVDEHGRISMIEASARWHHLSSQEMIEPARQIFRDLRRKREKVRSLLPEIDVRDRTVIIVGQGLVTGARMLGAVQSVRDRGARKVAAAAPAGAQKATWQLHETADVVCIPHTPSTSKGIEGYYENYHEVSDELMLAILQRWVDLRPPQTPGVRTLVLRIDTTNQHALSCEIDLPPNMAKDSGPYPAVLFAHGFDSDAHSPRNVAISRRLAKRSIIGVRFDFTGHGRSEGTREQATDRQMIEDLHAVFLAARQLREIDDHRIAIVGSGSGAMIALHYAAQNHAVQTLVIRGPVCGQEIDASRRVACPALIIHAERDTALEDSVKIIDRELRSMHELLRIKASNRMFDDPISRELMVNATVDWLVDHLIHMPPSQDRPEVEVDDQARMPTNDHAATPRSS